MSSAISRAPSKRRSRIACTTLALAAPMLVAALASPSPAGGSSHDPVLVGRAVLPFDTYAGPPVSGAFVDTGGDGVVNGVEFPSPDNRSKVSRGSSTAGSAARSSRCPTTASAPRQTPATS